MAQADPLEEAIPEVLNCDRVNAQIELAEAQTSHFTHVKLYELRGLNYEPGSDFVKVMTALHAFMLDRDITKKIDWTMVILSPICEQENFNFRNLNLLKLTANQTKIVADVQGLTKKVNYVPVGG